MPEISEDTKIQAKKTFIKALENGFSICGAASKARMSRVTFYRWKEDDPTFAKEWDEARDAGGDWYEDQNRKQANKGNMAAILNGLRMHKRITDRVDNVHTGEVRVRVVYDD